MTKQTAESLKRTLKPIHLWAIAVGLVISGEYFGWNLGWGVAGTVGFLISSLIVTVMYITFIFSFTELTTAIPHAGGAFAYAYRAFGPIGGFIAGYATLIDFLLSTPAIAFALGKYLHFIYPAIPALESALFFNLVFVAINISGIKESATFSVFITMLAVAELLLYMGVVGPHFEMSKFLAHSDTFQWAGVFAGLPFAVWFFLAIEGVAMVAEEVSDPIRNIPKGYISGLATLVVLALGVMVLTGGVTDWRTLTAIDDPLPEAIAAVLGKTSGLTTLFASIGLFGLVASFHATIIASSRQIFAMARSGYLPKGLAAVNHRFKTPHWSIIASGGISFIAILIGDTGQVIMLSVTGAVVMYMMSMASLFVLRRKEPSMPRPFAAPFYPYFPAIALVICAVCLVAIVYYNLILSLVFFGGMAVAWVIFASLGKHKEKITDDILLGRPAAVSGIE